MNSKRNFHDIPIEIIEQCPQPVLECIKEIRDVQQRIAAIAGKDHSQYVSETDKLLSQMNVICPFIKKCRGNLLSFLLACIQEEILFYINESPVLITGYIVFLEKELEKRKNE